jgi:hypothetical protein
MFSELALWQEVALVILAFLSAIYVFYFRIWVALATGSDLLFVASLAVCVASIAAPPLFDLGARYLVDMSPLPEALVDADSKVAALEALPSELVNRALEKIGYEREADLAAPPPQPGPFQNQVRPAVEALVAVLLRAASSMSSFFLLLMALALRSSTSTAREMHQLSSRLDRLALAKATIAEPSSSPTVA